MDNEKRCGNCKHWVKENILGSCEYPLPYWITDDPEDSMTSKKSGVGCCVWQPIHPQEGKDNG